MKPTTLDLIEKNIADGTSERKLCAELGVSHSTINMAKRRGRASPILAAKLAERLGLDPALWMFQAATEAEPDMTPPGAIRKAIANLRI